MVLPAAMAGLSQSFKQNCRQFTSDAEKEFANRQLEELHQLANDGQSEVSSCRHQSFLAALLLQLGGKTAPFQTVAFGADCVGQALLRLKSRGAA
jgi:hypothetical protein